MPDDLIRGSLVEEQAERRFALQPARKSHPLAQLHEHAGLEDPQQRPTVLEVMELVLVKSTPYTLAGGVSPFQHIGRAQLPNVNVVGCQCRCS